MFSYKDGLLGTPDSVADFNSTLNAYKLFCDDLKDSEMPVSDLDPESRCVFGAGMKNIRHYTIELGAGLIFNYAVDASWQFPQGFYPWDVPDDFGPGANKPEAWNIVITELENTLWNDGSENGGDLSLQVDVWDHFDADLNTVFIDSPGNFPLASAPTASGGGVGYSTYQVDIFDATPAEGSIEMLISVESEAIGYQDLLPGEPVTSYFMYTASVDDHSPVIECGTGVHSYEGQHFITGFPDDSWRYCQRDDLTILETGAHAGECVVKKTYNIDSTYSGDYIRFDPDDPADAAGTFYFNLPGRSDSLVAYVTMNPSIDQNPVNGHIGVVNGRMFDAVQIVDEDGNHIDDVIVTDPQTPSDRYPVIPAVDFDGDGDMWLITDVIDGPSHGGENPVWQLRHYELQPSKPFYVENVSDRLDITQDLKNDAYPSYPYVWYLADLAISYEEDCLFTFGSTIQSPCRSIFVKYDLSTSPPTKAASEDLLPFAIAICSTPYSGMARGDIEIDHVDPLYEKCRVLVMYQKWNGTSSDIHLMKMDTDMNILADEIMTDIVDPWSSPFGMTINTDPDLRNLIMIDYNLDQPRNDFHYYSMPASDW